VRGAGYRLTAQGSGILPAQGTSASAA